MNGRDQHPDVELVMAYAKKAQRSRDRKIDFLLSFADYKKLRAKKKCFYTGWTLTNEYNGGTRDLTHFTLDRINSDLPYTKENTVVCCDWFNGLKNRIESLEGDKLDNFAMLQQSLTKVIINWQFPKEETE